MKVVADIRGFTANITRLKSSSKRSVQFSMDDIANEILRLSQIEVPHDIGTLQNSGAVDEGLTPDSRIIGYHTPYAARLHEHPEYHFQRGRKGKYLEDPIRRNESVLGIKFAKNFEGGLK